jgi:ABC-2 type transport system ATP-binding protein
MLAIEISNLYKEYPGGVQAVNGLSLNVKSGSFFTLLGPNGSGKSTTLGIISSLVQKTSGSVKVLGHDIDKNLIEAKHCIGLVPQDFNFSMFETVLDILINQAGYFGIKRDVAKIRAEKYIQLLGLWHKKDARGGQLSGGMKRRLMIARAMMHQPKILILDEPTAGLDIEVRHQIWNFLQLINKEQKITIVLTTHYLEEAERLCDTVAIINEGKIIRQDSMENLLSSFSIYSYIAELEEPLAVLPDLKDIELKLSNPYKIEIDFEHPNSISSLMEQFSLHKIKIKSLTPQESKLEKLFLNLTGADL